MDKELIIINRIQKQLKDLKVEDRCRILSFCQERAWKDRDEGRVEDRKKVLSEPSNAVLGVNTSFAHD